ncbi:hypothetical protein NBRC116599_23470 [Aquicoccus sp. SU-CL01552]
MTWEAKPTGKRGRQPTYSDAAIQTCLTMKVLFGMALRQTTGFVEIPRPSALEKVEWLPPPKSRRDETSRDSAAQCTDGQRMHCMKLLGQRPMARAPERQVAELQVRVAIMNGFTALGIPITEAVGQVCPGKGEAWPSIEFHNGVPGIGGQLDCQRRSRRADTPNWTKSHDCVPVVFQG